MSADVLSVVFERVEDLRLQWDHARHGGLYLPVPHPAPDPFVELSLLVFGPDGALAEFAAQVVHLTPDGMAVSFASPAEAAAALKPLWQAQNDAPERRPPHVHWGRPNRPGEGNGSPEPQKAKGEEPLLQQHLEALLAREAYAEGEDRPNADPAASELDDDEPHTRQEREATLYDRIKNMSVPEKMKLAQHGDRSARLILMKDTQKVIHTFVIQNPRITSDEIRYIAGYRQTNPEALKLISDNREWMQNPRIVSALVANPKTPARIAIKLLDKLPPAELRRIAKSDNYPRAVTLAARKRVIGD